MPNSGRKGTRAERELVRMIDETAWAVLRIPASGSATARDLPDVLAMRAHPVGHVGHPLAELVAIESKARDSGSVHLDAEEIDALIAFSQAAGARPYVAIRPNFKTSDYDRWQFVSAYGLNETGTGYSVRQDDLPGRSFADIFESPTTETPTLSSYRAGADGGKS